MVNDFDRHGLPMIGVQEVPRDTVDRYGIVKLKEGSMELEDIVEKPTIEEAPSNLADFGRMILNKDIVETLKDTALGKGNELWITDAIRSYVQSGGGFMAKKVEAGEWMTTGDPLNYLKATLAYAMDREDISQELKKYLQKYL
jgi:UTP--glucose-1-phosphate uridylyltransferase